MSQSTTTPNTPLPEDLRLHLEFIQNVITRMNSNSFTIKGWAVTIVAALLAVFASTQNVTFLAVSILPIFIFWWLDARYLQMERQYRSLFDAVASRTQSIRLYDLKVDKQFITENKNNNFKSTLKADTILPFYLFLALLAIVSIVTIFALSESKEEKIVKMQIVGEVSTKTIDTVKTFEIERITPPLTNTHQIKGLKTTSPLDTSKAEVKKLSTPVNTPKPGIKK